MSPTDEHAPTIRSAEGVALHMPLAGPTARMLAYGVDAAAVWFVLIAVLLVVILLSPSALQWAQGKTDRFRTAPEAAFAGLTIVLTIVSYFGELLYFTGFELVTGGRSPGKYLVGLRVVRTDGLRVDARAIWIRNLLRAVDVLPTTYVVGLTSMVISSHGQRLGDLAAGTFVVRVAPAASVDPLAIPPGTTPLPLSRAQLQRLGDNERLLIQRTLRRAQPLTGERRDAVLRVAATALVERLALDAALADTPEPFLYSLLLTMQRGRLAI